MKRLSIAESLFVILIGASDASGGVEWDRVEPVLPSEIELGEADCDSAGPHMRHFVAENKNCTIIRKFH